MADATVLCVDDDDESALSDVADAVATAGYTVETATTLSAARARFADIDAVVTAARLPDGTGLELVRALREARPGAAAVLFTACDVEDLPTEDADGHAAEYVLRDAPDAYDRLVERLSFSIEQRTQRTYPLPADESARVDAVATYESVLDDAAPALSRLADLATALFDLPMAGVGLVAEHEQRFAACVGTDFGTVAREDTLCTYAMLDPEVTVIEDAREDPRFADNEALGDVRFYASANLTAPSGHVVGTVCVYDTTPGTFPAADRERLQTLADEAMTHLELRRRLAATEEGDDD